MKRYTIFISMFFLILGLTGCGAGGTNDNDKQERTDTTKVPANYNKGAISLWDYLVPETDTTNNYIKTSGDQTEKYRTRYTKSADTVTEVSDFSQNEKTIYKNEKNNITILFYTDGSENGRLELKPTVDIGDIVTIKKSDCTLVKLWDEFHFDGKSFKDVIEIRCGDTPGYYQRGVGEILQQKPLTESGGVETKLIDTK